MFSVTEGKKKMQKAKLLALKVYQLTFSHQNTLANISALPLVYFVYSFVVEISFG